LSRVKPLSFPITAAEVQRDIDAAFPASEPPGAGWTPASPPPAEPDGDVEDRFRMGSE
jgi:hypothetical protein